MLPALCCMKDALSFLSVPFFLFYNIHFIRYEASFNFFLTVNTVFILHCILPKPFTIISYIVLNVSSNHPSLSLSLPLSLSLSSDPPGCGRPWRAAGDIRPGCSPRRRVTPSAWRFSSPPPPPPFVTAPHGLFNCSAAAAVPLPRVKHELHGKFECNMPEAGLHVCIYILYLWLSVWHLLVLLMSVDTSVQIGFRLIGHSKLTLGVNVSVRGSLYSYVGPVTMSQQNM